ncbi:MAG: hypothetical protein BWY67_00001 [Bacteroidetes bacterium ADurb.Bin397]|nr:MAG: hypothetical protein BWY67_00001 [Bacteroidetes bacterium ADurb.Bin397]
MFITFNSAANIFYEQLQLLSRNFQIKNNTINKLINLSFLFFERRVRETQRFSLSRRGEFRLLTSISIHRLRSGQRIQPTTFNPSAALRAAHQHISTSANQHIKVQSHLFTLEPSISTLRRCSGQASAHQHISTSAFLHHIDIQHISVFLFFVSLHLRNHP